MHPMRFAPLGYVALCILLLIVDAASAEVRDGYASDKPLLLARHANVSITLRRTPGKPCDGDLCSIDLLANNKKFFSAQFPPHFVYGGGGVEGRDIRFGLAHLEESLTARLDINFRASKKPCKAQASFGEIALTSNYTHVDESKSGWIRSVGCFALYWDIRRLREAAE